MGWKMPRGRPSFSISASSQSLLSAPTSAVAHGGRYLVVSVQVELKGGHSVGGEFVFPVFDDDCHRVVVGDVLQCQFPVFEGMDDGVFAFDVGDDVASRSFPLVVGYSNIYRMSAGLCHSREGKQQHEHAK